MSIPQTPEEDLFLPGGKIRANRLTPPAAKALDEAIRLARETRWDCVRSPHIFMGLLADPDPVVCNWGRRLGADLPKLLGQFQELFHQEAGDSAAVLALHREFLSDNALRLLREAQTRATDHHRPAITPVDLLITLLTSTNSIVADCFERIGVTAAKLTEQAVIAEQQADQF
ncbi:MAG TPA: Clp protease N-terminal domain-containing protein [Gemmataceae bacterium]|nr:Clp protease N-terminal domain-containing protein [Gemmataceae bacterium]